MDDRRFDSLARALRSRRSALTSFAGGIAALLGLTVAEPRAHNATARCRSLSDPVKRRRCRRQARAHNRLHQCKPKPPATYCGGRCAGTAVNNCGQRVSCPACPAGRDCLGNGTCNRPCAVLGVPGDCPAACKCGLTAVEGPMQCAPAAIIGCTDVPNVCATTAQCPLGYFCGAVVSSCGSNRCIPVCPG
jgi:hypothetical protein